MKKAKVKKITKMDKKDSYGNTSYIIELENGDKGFYTSKDENQTKFVVGQESPEYNIEEKQGSTGAKYFKITLPQSEKFQRGGGRPVEDPKVKIVGFAMSYTKDLIVAGKIGMQDMEVNFNKIFNVMISKV